MPEDVVRAAIQDDEDLREYAKLRLAGWKRREALANLGWDAKRREAVDRRYRRFREKIVASGIHLEPPRVELPPGVSDANCTVVKERLRFPVHPASESTLSGRVVYDLRRSDDQK